MFYSYLRGNSVRERAKASEARLFCGGSAVALTIKEIENAKPKDKKYKLADGGGLCLIIQPWGAKFWLWRYRFDGTEKNMTFGEYPLVGPKDARELHYAAKKLLASGVNPMAERKAEAEAKQQEVKALEREADNSFEKVARKWWAWWSIGKSPRHAEKAQRLRTFAKVVLATLPFKTRPNLLHGGLPYIDAGLPINVNGLNLLAHRSPVLCGLRRSLLRAASG